MQKTTTKKTTPKKKLTGIEKLDADVERINRTNKFHPASEVRKKLGL